MVLNYSSHCGAQLGAIYSIMLAVPGRLQCSSHLRATFLTSHSSLAYGMDSQSMLADPKPSAIIMAAE